MIARFIQKSWLVIAASLVFGMLVAAVYGALEGRIEANARRKLESGMKLLLAKAESFDTVTDAAKPYYVGRNAQGEIVGYAFKAEGGGFADTIELLIATDADMKTLLGIAVLKSNETPGFGDKMKEDKFKGQFTDCPISQKLTVVKTGDRSRVDSEIVAITGATITSEAVTTIVNKSVNEMRAIIKK